MLLVKVLQLRLGLRGAGYATARPAPRPPAPSAGLYRPNHDRQNPRPRFLAADPARLLRHAEAHPLQLGLQHFPDIREFCQLPLQTVPFLLLPLSVYAFAPESPSPFRRSAPRHPHKAGTGKMKALFFSFSRAKAGPTIRRAFPPPLISAKKRMPFGPKAPLLQAIPYEMALP